MNATITYEMQNRLNTWNEKQEKNGLKAWFLVKVTTPQFGNIIEEPVACFNLDSEAETFQGHVLASGQDGKLIKITATMQRYIKEMLSR